MKACINYTFTTFLRDLTAMTAIGATMMLMLYCHSFELHKTNT